jgi:hypothetical protein
LKALSDVRTKIHYVSQIPVESRDEEATPEQLEKLNQLQKQIRELESVLTENSISKNDSQSKKLVITKSESTPNDLAFKNIINDLRSLQSKFESTKQSAGDSSSMVDVEQDKLIKKKLKETLSELSRLKNEIQSLEEIDDSDLKSVDDLSINEKKSKMTKKSPRTGTKKSKMTKKSPRTGNKKPSKF